MSEETKTASVSNDNKQKKSPLVIILVILGVILLIGLALTLWACKSATNFVTKTLPEVEKSISVSSSSDTETLTQSATWPTDAPSSIPNHSDGKILYAYKSTTSGITGWVIAIENVSRAQYDAYVQKLTSAGWTQTDQIDAGLAITTTLMMDNNEIQYVFDPSTDGVLLSIYQK